MEETFVIYVFKNRSTRRVKGCEIHPNMLHDFEGIVRVELYQKEGSSSKCIHVLYSN